MFDLGTSFVASAARDPNTLAIADGAVRLTYHSWYKAISSVVAGLDALGLRKGDHLVTLLQNRWEAATLHWACQFSGIVITPINWRSTSQDVDFVIEDADAALVAFESASADAIAESRSCRDVKRLAIGLPAGQDEIGFGAFATQDAPLAIPRAGADDWSLMLYTSGTTGKPKGVPRRHRVERAAAVAHVAQNLYAQGERTLGAMPLYHTMGVRSLLAMSLIGGVFVCLPRFDPAAALALIAAERISNLYLVPTLYHDLVHHPDCAATDRSSVRKLGFAGAPMTDGLLAAVNQAFKPDLFVNHYGSSEIYTFTVNQNAAGKPGSAGRAGINQIIRVVKLGANDPNALTAPGEEGEIIALATSDEAFEGYWKRPEADAKSLRGGWYFTGDTGHTDGDGDLYVTGRADDMIITGGENVSPVEVENCLSRHPNVLEAAVVGLPDERWGRVVTAFVKRREVVATEGLDEHCRASGLAPFKRPRRYVFVEEIPKSPVGKLLRRKLVDGDYVAEQAAGQASER